MASRKPTTHKGYRLQAHDPVRGLALASVAVALLVLAGAAMYSAGYRAANETTARERIELGKLKDQVRYLTDRNKELTTQAARLGRSGEIDRAAAKRVQKSLNEMETRLASMSEELAFYRSIVAPSGGETKFHLQRFQLRRAASGGGYGFSLVLAQMQSKGLRADGRITAAIEGRQDGRPRTLDLASLAHVNLSFAFKYFQDFEGTFALPAGFTPEKVVITVHSSTRGLAGIEKSYTWDEALKGG